MSFVTPKTSKQRNDERPLCKMACSERELSLLEPTVRSRNQNGRPRTDRLRRTGCRCRCLLCLENATRSTDELRVSLIVCWAGGAVGRIGLNVLGGYYHDVTSKTGNGLSERGRAWRDSRVVVWKRSTMLQQRVGHASVRVKHDVRSEARYDSWFAL